jgi:copper chaperone
MTGRTLGVEGMGCGHCKAAVEGELNRLAGVDSSDANAEKGNVEIYYDANELTAKDLEGAIEEAGYTVAA